MLSSQGLTQEIRSRDALKRWGAEMGFSYSTVTDFARFLG